MRKKRNTTNLKRAVVSKTSSAGQTYLSIPGIVVKNESLILGIIIIVTAFLYAFVNFQKHNHFQTFAWDTSVFDQQIYLASQLKLPFSSLHRTNGLADHFHPLLIISGALLYRIWADPRIIMALQSLVVSVSAIPLYLITKRRLLLISVTPFIAIITAWAMIFMYLFAVAVQAMTLDEIHDDVWVALPLLWLVYFVHVRNWRWYWISYTAVLLTKEEYGFLGIALAVYIFFTTKRWRTALITGIIGALVFYMLLYIVMPYLGGQTYIHFRQENRPGYIVKTLINNPHYVVSRMFNHSAKRQTWFTSIVAFAGLPAFSLVDLVTPLASLAVRFYDETTVRRYEFNNHYASPFIPLFAVAAAVGYTKLLRSLSHRFGRHRQTIAYAGIFYLLSVTLLQNIAFHGPLNSLFKKSFYETHAWENDAHALIRQVPEGVVIAAQNSLLPHLSHRSDFYLLPEIKTAQYIAVDFSPGPNKFGAYTADQMRKIIQIQINNGSFYVIWQKGDAYLLKRV